MGGKFKDGFLSAAAAAYLSHYTPVGNGFGAFEDLGSTSSQLHDVVGRTAMAAIVGGTVSRIGGGDFANGAYTAAFQHLFNAEAGAWLEGEKTPADVKREQKQWEAHKAKVKSEILSDGRLTRKEANLWYRIGGGDSLTLDPNNIGINFEDVDQNKWQHNARTGTLTQTVTPSNFADWSVHGDVTLKKINSAGAFRVYDADYDFNMRTWRNPVNWHRNVNTIIGGIGAGNGTDYNIQYRGEVSR